MKDYDKSDTMINFENKFCGIGINQVIRKIMSSIVFFPFIKIIKNEIRFRNSEILVLKN